MTTKQEKKKKKRKKIVENTALFALSFAIGGVILTIVLTIIEVFGKSN
jgi:cytochrome c biogenesis protein CcdA